MSELQKKVQQREEDMDKTEERLNLVTIKLNEATHAGDESERYLNKQTKICIANINVPADNNGTI